MFSSNANNPNRLDTSEWRNERMIAPRGPVCSFAARFTRHPQNPTLAFKTHPHFNMYQWCALTRKSTVNFAFIASCTRFITSTAQFRAAHLWKIATGATKGSDKVQPKPGARTIKQQNYTAACITVLYAFFFTWSSR